MVTKDKDNAVRLGVILFGIAFLMAIIARWSYIPYVYVSWERKECVRVESVNPTHNCENLPEKYDTKWVK